MFLILSFQLGTMTNVTKFVGLHLNYIKGGVFKSFIFFSSSVARSVI
jgi:hypothetical protein